MVPMFTQLIKMSQSKYREVRIQDVKLRTECRLRSMQTLILLDMIKHLVRRIKLKNKDLTAILTENKPVTIEMMIKL